MDCKNKTSHNTNPLVTSNLTGNPRDCQWNTGVEEQVNKDRNWGMKLPSSNNPVNLIRKKWQWNVELWVVRRKREPNIVKTQWLKDWIMNNKFKIVPVDVGVPYRLCVGGKDS